MPYKPTGRPSGRPKAPTPIVPATPTELPAQGTLQETIMLGDSASVTANPATKLRWFATRAEIQIRIQNDEIGRAKNETAVAVQARTDAEAQLKTATDEITRLTAKLAEVESTHQRQLESEHRMTEEATERANVSYEKVKELEPDAQSWREQEKAKQDAIDAETKVAERRAKWQQRLDELTPIIKRLDVKRDQPTSPVYRPPNSVERELKMKELDEEEKLRDEEIELRWNLAHSFEEVEARRLAKEKAAAIKAAKAKRAAEEWAPGSDGNLSLLDAKYTGRNEPIPHMSFVRDSKYY